jgi:heptosyltransferase II
MDVARANRPLTIPEDGRILVRANNWIGDVVLSTPALHAVRAAFPNTSISVLAKPWVLPLLATHPAVDRLVLYDADGRHRGFPGMRRLAADLRSERFDCAILFQRAFEAALLSFWARIPRRAGLVSDGRSLLLTHRVPADPELFRIHRVLHNLELLSRLGIPPAECALHLPLDRAEMDRAHERLASMGLPLDRLCFGLNPGAAFGTAKRWKPERFAELSNRLTRAYGARGLIFGSASERHLGDTIRDMAPAADLVNLAGATTLGEAVALIGLCGLFVTNDSGLMHVAAALDVPLVSLFGPTNPRVTSPWCERHRLVRKEGISCSPCMQRDCKEGHHLCMEALSTDEVYTAACDLIGRTGAEPPRTRRSRLQVSDRRVPILDFGKGRG